ncbi:branched-chain amino acid ABC transporter permease [Paraburkholderia rhynchosiae]|uniref:Branched-chain amino acid ABC transporter permease n=1 Tax=Paraburkholderia rhynchosiae TaxID=487049 RepID=A0A2N7W7Y3_9BURK|nr:branched-chain amino acid ABC transporter permease [Paraburkholderia rhynchosiae]PMS25508.1 branched-chain amino acid ABC transporter permease [Paraburkholderia rhynchosiae]CAB3733665.1 High-affinity branched-chain amino acid transport system permease protein LivH [Paraburkholderia rhynchosiae]
MEAFGQQLLAGVGTGSIYAIVALALAVIYQATHHVNFAQGEMAMFSTYLAWVLIQAGLPYWAAFLVTIAASFIMGAVLELVVIRPLRDAPDLSMVVVFIGLLVTFHGLAGLLFGYDSHDFPSLFANVPWGFPQLLSADQAGSIALTFFLVALLFVFFYRTSLGLKMRAVAQNRVSSQLVGISVGKMLMLGWGLAGAIGAVSGLMVAPMVFLDPSMMMGAVLYAFAGALLGGIGNPAGAVVGGFLVGIAENLLGTYVVGTDLKLSIALLLIVVVLIFAPDGLFGRRVVARV